MKSIDHIFPAWVLLFLMIASTSLHAQAPKQKKLTFSFESGASMGRWIYDKGLNTSGDFHQGYDRSHLAVYIPIGLQIGYNWKKWSLGIAGRLSWLSDDELISSTSKPLVPREYYITDGSDIAFTSQSMFLTYTLIELKRYKLTGGIWLGTFKAEQDHPREAFFGRHYLIDLGISNQIFLSKDWFILVRPIFRRKGIGVTDPSFPGESHEIITFGIDYGFGFNIF